MILILKLIVKLGECIRYFRRGGWQQEGGDGTTNNKMGNESDNSMLIVLFLTITWNNHAAFSFSSKA